MIVGIMSMQRIVNYGSYLQAYALKAILEQCGCKVQFVDYLVEDSIAKETIDRSQKISRYFRALSPKYIKWRREQVKMNTSFLAFIHKYNDSFLPSLGVTENYNIRPKLDALIIGSDEVFNCTQAVNNVGCSWQLFGKDNRAEKLISYAASFGNTTHEKLMRYGIEKEVRERLLDFNCISVRDLNSYNIVNVLTGITPKKHVDPVLAYSFPEVEQFKVEFDNYIIVYAYADRFSEDEVKAVKRFARKKGKRIITLGYYQPNLSDIYILADPIEVLAYIKKADYVITDTFHGSIFSIKYQKQFVVIIRNSNREKIADLLSEFSLSDRALHNLSKLEIIIEKRIPKYQIIEKINNESHRAYDYLNRSLLC